MNLFPIFLKLEGRRCLVVGGGQVGAQKIAGLLEAGAQVTVVDPSPAAVARELFGTRVTWQARGREDSLTLSTLVYQRASQ